MERDMYEILLRVKGFVDIKDDDTGICRCDKLTFEEDNNKWAFEGTAIAEIESVSKSESCKQLMHSGIDHGWLTLTNVEIVNVKKKGKKSKLCI